MAEECSLRNSMLLLHLNLENQIKNVKVAEIDIAGIILSVMALLLLN